MNILNLVYKEKSIINYDITQFPDGQQNITIYDDNKIIDSNKFGFIISRLNSWKDLEIIICATQSLKLEYRVDKIILLIPYLMGSRSDRKFETGSVNYLKNVIAPVLNLQNYYSVQVFDAHSYITEAVINNLDNLNNELLVKHAIDKIIAETNNQDYAFVSPDTGAYAKVVNLGVKYNKDIVISSKIRDKKTGKVKKISIDMTEVPENINNFVVVDDIGDGFGTFIKLAEKVKELRPNANLFLIVSHTIQESGAINALKYYNKIFTTNSVKDFNIENLDVLNLF